MPDDPNPLEDPFICSLCGARSAGPGDCSTHSEEPLVDLRDQEVRLMLDKADWRRQRRRQVLLGLLVILGVSPFIVVSLVVGIGSDGVLARVAVWVGRIAVLVAIGSAAWLIRRFPAPRLLPPKLRP